MRSPFALTIITFLLLVSLGNAQSDAPPPSRLLRRNQSETPPPSRPLGKVTDEASSSKAPSKVAPFPQPFCPRGMLELSFGGETISSCSVISGGNSGFESSTLSIFFGNAGATLLGNAGAVSFG